MAQRKQRENRKRHHLPWSPSAGDGGTTGITAEEEEEEEEASDGGGEEVEEGE